MANRAVRVGKFDPDFQKLIRKAIQHRMLTREEERDLILRAQSGDKAAMRELGETNLKLILFFANRYGAVGAVMGFTQSDLFNEAYAGFHRAVHRFKVHMKTRLSTYAQWWIRHTLSRAIEDRGRTIRIPVHTQQSVLRIERETRKFLTQYGRLPTREELAKLARIPLAKLAVAENVPFEPLSYDAPVPMQEDGLHWLDMYRDPNAEERTPLEQAAVAQDLRRLAEARKTLSSLENAILDHRYRRERTLEETAVFVAPIAGAVLSRERIRQIQNDAQRKLRNIMSRHEDIKAA